MSFGFLDLTDMHDALKKRDSYAAFVKKFPDVKMEKAHRDFHRILDEVMSAPTEKEKAAATYISGLMADMKSQTGALESIATRKHGTWVLKDENGNSEHLAELVEKYDEAHDNLNRLLRGEEVNEVEAPERLRKAFTQMESATLEAEGVMNGWFGRARIDGVGKAAENSLQEMKFWTEANKDHRGLGFGKCAVAAGGAVAIAHGALADKNKDGEERNGLMRLAEVLVGAGAIGGALVFGKAR